MPAWRPRSQWQRYRAGEVWGVLRSRGTEIVLRFASGRGENAGFREPERSVLRYVSTGSAENWHLQPDLTRISTLAHRMALEPLDQMVDQRPNLARQMPPMRIDRLQRLAGRQK